MPRILIAPTTLAGIEAPYIGVLKAAGFELVFPKVKVQLNEEQILDHLKGVVASVAGSEPYTRGVIAAHPQLRAICRVGVGWDAVDGEAATDHGVAVTIAPNTNHDAVAEHTFTLILALAKDLINQHQGTVAQKWPRKSNLPLRGRTLGIAGLGRIGKAVALRGECFGMPLLAYDPFPDQAFIAAHKIRLLTWEELVRQSDYLSLHMPATPEARQLINAKSLAMMKPTSFLVNTARGALVNEADLVAALQKGAIAGAGIDVFEHEPPGDHPLFHLPNVVVTPHAAGVDLQSRDDMAMSAAQAIVSLSRGEWPAEKVVNPKVRDKFKW